MGNVCVNVKEEKEEDSISQTRLSFFQTTLVLPPDHDYKKEEEEEEEEEQKKETRAGISWVEAVQS
ncbi:hypothetical protein E2C01_097385 [Portunus trituberculatus]|uniref:Uncharacterized protein n=1 Tax=Portunus trituberculatus TaxID=210409 RepID=A0A5B7K4C2_PORTR|nr:hypothetical protein [Portunus trituberculatus]